MVDTKHVLVVDDDPGLLDLITDLLESEGYSVAGARNGAQAVIAVNNEQPGLVLLDMQMPVLNGWEFAETMKYRGLKCPLVVMTASDKGATWAAEVGADDYLSKPFDLVDVTAMVARFCTS